MLSTNGTKRKRSTLSGLDNDGPESKRTAACTACRKQKIKCEMMNERPPCTRCSRRGIVCVLHTARKHPMVDQKHIGLLGKDVASLYATLKQVCQTLNLEQPPPLASEREIPQHHEDPTAHDGFDDQGECELSPPSTPLPVGAPIDTYLTEAREEGLQDPNSPQRLRARRKTMERPDLITKGLISQEDAESLVQRYLTHLDRFLYAISSHYTDANQVRRASPTLLAAMCATAAFQDVKQYELFEICNREYRSLVSASTFENRNTEYILALCIGSFFLPDASRILSSEAIRRAADNRLHLAFHKMAQPSTSPNGISEHNGVFSDARSKIRLWYLLYVCDQHLSILHNRDPLIRQEMQAIEHRNQFLADQAPSPALSQDARLMSQVALLVIMSQIRDLFGSEQNHPLSKSLSIQFQHFSRELDQWYGHFSSILEIDPYIGAFPLAGLTMHYQFAKLYLGHHVFRGLEANPIPQHFVSVAAEARNAALNIFAFILENDAFRANVVGMPHYFHIMISFAGHFLLEVCMKYKEQLNVVPEEDFRRVSNVVALFAQTAASSQHPISRVTSGLLRALTEWTASLGMAPIMTTSPFANVDWSAAGAHSLHDNMMNAPDMQSNFGMPLATEFPDDFLYAGFGNPVFLDPQL